MRIAFPGALTPQMSAIILSFGLAATGARLSRHCDVPTLAKGFPSTAGRALHCRLSHTLNVTGLTTSCTSLQVMLVANVGNATVNSIDGCVQRLFTAAHPLTGEIVQDIADAHADRGARWRSPGELDVE